MELTIQEASAQGTAMVTWLHQSLAASMGEIATLKGQIAILEYRLANPSPKEAPVPDAS